MPLHLAIVVSDSHTPGARPSDMASDRTQVLAPLLDLLESRPSIRLALHLSQTFLGHIEEQAPELVPRLQALAKKKRVTFLCSLSSGGIPWLGFERDAMLQLKQHRSYLERTFSVPVRGAWPVGLAWSPSWARFLGRAGLRFTLCDTRALVAGGCPAPVRSWVNVRAESHRAVLLPFDHDLVHRIPACPPADVVGQLRVEAEYGCEARVLVLPMARLSRWGASQNGHYITHLMDGLAKQGGWMRIVVPQLLVERADCGGTVHPPESTPLHVGVGCLSEGPGRRLLDAADALVGRRDKVLSAQVPGFTGPPLDVSFDAWPEAGNLVDRSARVATLLAGLRRRVARDKSLQPVLGRATRALHRGTSSVALWDGDGGNVGEPLARHGCWQALIEADDAVWAAGEGTPEVEVPDDGGPVHLRTVHLMASVDPVGGGIVELSLRGLGNLTNVLTPLARPWGDRFADPALPCLVDGAELDEEADEATEEPTEEPTDAPAGGADTPLELDSASLEPVESLTHHVPAAHQPFAGNPAAPVEPGALGLPVFSRSFSLFQDLLLSPVVSTHALARGMAAELGDFADGGWRVERAETDGADVELLLVREGTVLRPGGSPGMVQITKRIRFGGADNTVTVRWTAVNRSREPVRARHAVVLPLSVDGRIDPQRTLHLPGMLPRQQDAMGMAEDVSDFALRYGDLGLLVRARPHQPVRIDHFPIHAPVRRRKGHCAVFQGTVAVLSWPLELWGEETREASMVLEIHKR